MTVTAASIQLPAGEVAVKVHRAEHDKLPDDTWFLTLATVGGYVTLGGTLADLYGLAGQITDAVERADA